MIKYFSRQYWIIALGFGLSMAIFMTIYYVIADSPVSFLVFNFFFMLVFSGLGFATMMTWLARRMFKKINIDIPDGEQLIKEYGANLFKGKEGVGGKIALTNKNIIFKSHKLNIQSGITVIPVNTIRNIETFDKFFGQFKNGTYLTTPDKKYKLIIQERDDFIKRLGDI